jgi:hypothetical protein
VAEKQVQDYTESDYGNIFRDKSLLHRTGEALA